MKILKYEKKGPNQYKIHLENKETILLYEETILNKELLLTKEIDSLEEIYAYNAYYEAYYKAIKYITRKIRSEKEVKKYLAEYDNKIVEATVQKLKEQGYLKEEQYIKAYIHDAILLKKKGYTRIKETLLKEGFPISKVLTYLNEIDASVWEENLKKIIEKKMKQTPTGSAKVFYKKVKEYALNEGYALEAIERMLKDYEIDDTRAFEKDLKRVKAKVEKKYEGREREEQILTRLLAKGYSYEQIKKNI